MVSRGWCLFSFIQFLYLLLLDFYLNKLLFSIKYEEILKAFAWFSFLLGSCIAKMNINLFLTHCCLFPFSKKFTFLFYTFSQTGSSSLLYLLFSVSGQVCGFVWLYSEQTWQHHHQLRGCHSAKERGCRGTLVSMPPVNMWNLIESEPAMFSMAQLANCENE